MAWTCRRCKTRHHGNTKACPCGTRRPTRRRPKHQLALEEPYESWVARYGEVCGICGRPPGPRRKLDRDHSHRTGKSRGLLCHRCNRSLPNWVTAKWLRLAAAYLEAAEKARD